MTTGLVEMTPEDYRAAMPDALSPSLAKLLLDEGGPALFRYRTMIPAQTREFDMGHAAHALVLGKGAEQLVVVQADSWRSKAAQIERDAAYAVGKTPLLPKDMTRAEDMALALTQNQLAVESLQGRTEVAAFWQEPDGVWLRGQMDVFADGSHITDYKTSADASSGGVERAAWRLRYYLQAAWYVRLVQELTGQVLPFRFVFQEKEAPYRVSVWQVVDDYLRMGMADMDEAIETFRRCVREGVWPGFPVAVQPLAPPLWAVADDEIEV